MNRTSLSWTYNASNGFGGGTHNGTRILGDNLSLDNSSMTGDFTTAPIAAPEGGWGYFAAEGDLMYHPCTGICPAIYIPSPNGTIGFDLLRPGGSLVVAGIQPNARVPASAFDYPELSVRIRFSFTQPCYSIVINPPGDSELPPDMTAVCAPRLHGFGFGQRIADTGFGSGVAHTSTSDSKWLENLDATNLTRDPVKPVIPVAPSTYYSGYLSQPHVIQVGASWWMYMSAGTSNASYAGASIARAVSQNLTNWTMDPAPLLAPGASYDSYGLTHPYVMRDPEGTGYLMYYTGMTSAAAHSLVLARSDDGIAWTKVGVVIGPGSGWDSASAGKAAHITYNGSTDTWTMWYAGTDVPTGGGSSVGIATSHNGINWTRYGANPVLSRGDWYDQGDLQGGHMVEISGTLEYYHNCFGGTYRSCLAESTDGGYSWTKRGIALDVGTSWDDTYAADPSPVLTAFGFYVFYAGLNETRSQVGRTTVGERLPAFTGTFDLGPDPPLRLDRFSSNHPASAGSLVSYAFALRSSADGSAWTPWEAVTKNESTIGTPSQRFVEYKIEGRYWQPPLYPIFSPGIVELFTTSYADYGRYTSDELGFPDPVDRARVDPTVSGGGSVRWSFVQPPRPAAVSAPPGTWVDLAWGGGPLFAVGTLVGNQSVSPTLEAVLFTVRMYGLPSDITLRLGLNGTAALVYPGTLAGTIAANLSADELSGWIGEAVAADPNATFVDVPLYVGSSHFGVVTVGTLAINETFKKALSATFSPFGRLVINETETAGFRVSATTVGGAVISFSWWLDGAPVDLSGLGAPEFFSWTTGYDDAGLHLVNCSVSNGDYTVNWTWEVLVLNRNRPPQIVSFTPPSAVTIGKQSTVPFRVFAIDPDGDPMMYGWALDSGPERTTPGNETTLGRLSVGDHVLTGLVHDAESYVALVWSITVGNLAPVILSATPMDSSLSQSHGLPASLSVEAFDPDADPLSYRWFVDGVELAGSTLNATTVPAAALGPINLTVEVSDGLLSVRRSWLVNFTNTAPEIISRTPDGPSGLNRSLPQAFGVIAADADLDALLYEWELDGVVQAGSGPAYNTAGSLGPGPHTVRLRVSDPYGASASAEWSFTVAPEVKATTELWFEPQVFLFLLLAVVGAVALYLRWRAGAPKDPVE